MPSTQPRESSQSLHRHVPQNSKAARSAADKVNREVQKARARHKRQEEAKDSLQKRREQAIGIGKKVYLEERGKWKRSCAPEQRIVVWTEGQAQREKRRERMERITRRKNKDQRRKRATPERKKKQKKQKREQKDADKQRKRAAQERKKKRKEEQRTAETKQKAESARQREEADRARKQEKARRRREETAGWEEADFKRERAERKRKAKQPPPSSQGLPPEQSPPPLQQPRESLYSIVGIPSSSTHEEVVKACRKKRIEVHPDKVSGQTQTPAEEARVNERAKQVGHAADILCDAALRRKYDDKLARRG